jgi:3-deoxy-D-manno-octulosonate 8-phosphate phosphatase (KDO 8-P phosphatase)
MKRRRLSPVALERHARQIRLLLMDVDGVLTDGKLYYVPDGRGGMAESKGFDSQDGMGMRWLQEAGIPIGWISGRESPAVNARAQTLQISYVYQNHLAKTGPFQEILDKEQVESDEVCYIGDDLTDAVIMSRVGLAVAVRNARPEVKAIAHYVTSAAGGQGAVREVVEILLRAQKQWSKILNKYGVA